MPRATAARSDEAVSARRRQRAGEARLDRRTNLSSALGNQALLRLMRARSDGALVTAEAPAPQPTPPAAPAPQPAPPSTPAPQPAEPAPTLQAGTGKLEIDSTPATVKPFGSGLVRAFSGFRIEKSFTVKGYGKIDLPGSNFYDVGIVQNVFFDHMEQKFTDGDMLIDSVGPYVDVADTAEMPFIHDNHVAATTLNYGLSTSYTDVPSQRVTPLYHCKKSHLSDPVSADRTLTFRAGLVARHQISNKLFFLGASDKTYRVKWHADFNGSAWKIKDDGLKGTYPLSASAAALKLDGTIGNDAGDKAVKAEIAAFEQRCGYIADQQNDPDSGEAGDE